MATLTTGADNLAAASTANHLAEVLHTSDLFEAGISKFPTTPGQHVVILKSENLLELSESHQVQILEYVKQFANDVRQITGVKRCGLAYDGYRTLHVIPMHGLSDEWKPMLAPPAVFSMKYPGYLWTKSATHLPEQQLNQWQAQITKVSGLAEPDNTFLGDAADDNLFARLTRGEIPQWRIWEDSEHIAFLTPFANTSAASVLIPRKHLTSDILGLEPKDYRALMLATCHVAQLLRNGLHTTRVGIFFEGFEIDYAHVKFYPLIGDTLEPEGSSDEYHEQYPGYLSSRLGPEKSDTAYFKHLKHAHARLPRVS